jgi:hypothetical protein
MAIQIIDNFQVNVADAIDNRLVVGPSQFYTDKDDLPYKYAGMRVWDLNDGVSGVPYVWNGTTFETEASSGIAGSGTPGFIPKFIGGGNVLDDSIIQIVGSNVGIGISPIKTLHVNGDIQSDGSSGFYGKGTFITQLNASNITSGTLALSYLPNGSSGQVLQAGGSNPIWVNQNTLSVGDSINSDNIYHSDDGTTNTSRRIPFINSTGTSGYNDIKTNGGLVFTPNTQNLTVLGKGNFMKGVGVGFALGGAAAGAYGLYIQGNVFSTYPLFVTAASNNISAYFAGNIGINTSPSTVSGRHLSIAGGSSTYNVYGKLFTSGAIRSTTTVKANYWLYSGTGGSTGDSQGGIDILGRSEVPNNNLGIITTVAPAHTYIYRFANDNTTIRVDGNDGSANYTGAFHFYQDGSASKGGGAGSWLGASDKRLKTNIKSISNSLDKLKKLQAVEFNWKISGKKDVGFLADDVQTHFPNWVTERKSQDPEIKKIVNDDKVKSLEFPTEWYALVSESIKELDIRLKSIEDKLS